MNDTWARADIQKRSILAARHGRRERSADFPVRSNGGLFYGSDKICNPPFLRCCGLESPRSALDSGSDEKIAIQKDFCLSLIVFHSSQARRTAPHQKGVASR